MHFSDDEARRAWDRAAAAWDEFVESGADFYRTEVHGPALLDACGDVAGLRVLDLGCGQGWFCRQLADRGADVVGVDLSPGMLRHARQHEHERPMGVEYVELDATAVDERWPSGTFELATACMSIQDMPDPGAAIRSAAEVVGTDGRLVFSIPHPFTEMAYREWERDDEGRKVSLKVDRYFDTGPRRFSWQMSRLRYGFETPVWGLTLSEWSEFVSQAGFAVTKMREPRPSLQQVTAEPALDDCHRLPYFLVFECAQL